MYLRVSWCVCVCPLNLGKFADVGDRKEEKPEIKTGVLNMNDKDDSIGIEISREIRENSLGEEHLSS